MREIKLGGKEIRLRATPISAHFYYQEFKEDIVKDALKIALSGGQIEGIIILRMVWALAKTDKLGAQFPSFEKWLGQFEHMDLADEAMLTSVIEEVEDGLFRKAEQGE